MQRINTTNKATDLFGLGKHGYRAGNPATGQSATELSADVMNSLQEEIAGVIEGANIALVPGNNAQLIAAITALIASGGITQPQFDNTTKLATTAFVRNELLGLGNAAYASVFGASLAANGYQKLPSGLIIQWGAAAFSGSTSVAVTFPIAFTANVYQITCSQSDDATVVMGRQLTNVALTGFIARSSAVGFNCSWIAIGR